MNGEAVTHTVSTAAVVTALARPDFMLEIEVAVSLPGVGK
jgi:hypothetical protein